MTINTLVLEAALAGNITKTSADSSVQEDDFTRSEGRCTYAPSDADILFHTKYTISAGGDQSIDLSGSLEDALGSAAVFAKVYGFLIINDDATPGDFIWVGNSNFATWLGSATDKVKVGPQGCLMLTSPVDGYTVTATSGDILKVNVPGANPIIVRVIILGKA